MQTKICVTYNGGTGNIDCKNLQRTSQFDSSSQSDELEEDEDQEDDEDCDGEGDLCDRVFREVCDLGPVQCKALST